MKPPAKRKVLIGAVLLAALAGGIGAVAATSSSSPSRRQTYIDSVAKHLGVTPEKLSSALQAAADERIEAAVASGRLTKQQGEQLEQRVKEGRGPLFGGGLGLRNGGHRQALVGAAAGYLGISPQQLRSDRRAGKSLSEIAASTPGKSAAGLKAVLVAAAEKQLDAAVASGRLTSARAQLRRTKLPALVEVLMQSSGPGAMMHAHGKRGGAGFGWGPAPSGASA
jgi:hypothetical protein